MTCYYGYINYIVCTINSIYNKAITIDRHIAIVWYVYAYIL